MFGTWGKRPGNHEQESTMKAVAYKITITGKQEPVTTVYLFENLGFPAEVTTEPVTATFYWGIDRGPIPNLCDCGLTRGADVELVYAPKSDEEVEDDARRAREAREYLLADLTREVG